MTKEKNKVGIIGAGIGGLSAGALLSKKGYKVIIFEKEQQLGGRSLSFNGNTLMLEKYRKILSRFCMSVPFSEPSLEEIFEKNMLKGYTLDLGFHSIEGGTMSDVGRIILDIGKKVDMLGSKLGLIRKNDFIYPMISTKDRIRFLPNILRLVLSGESTMKKLDKVSIAETIERYGKGKMKLILELLPRGSCTVNDLSRISTGETFRASQSNLRRGSSPVGYPKGGLGCISNALAESIKRNGGEIHLGSPVKQILIENGKAYGLVIDDKKHNFDIIISNILVQDLFKIADEKHFPKEYVKMLKSLKGTGSLCAYYSLNKIEPEVIGKSFLFIERDAGVKGNDAVGMIEFVTALPESGLAPSSKHLVQSYIICTPSEAKSKKTLQELKEMLDKNLEHLIPDFRSHLNWAIYPSIWHLDGVAKTIDNDKPEIKTPVDNLYLIGDCVKAPGIGVNCAVNSARILTDNLLNLTI
ncbi:MAG: NAD(P)/FAD-dependent oxidoreductase [Thermoplasmatales archaeon]|nr:NAD(P)/FAD-dependent oxidoreductase [Thermoplasmatales archaeon]